MAMEAAIKAIEGQMAVATEALLRTGTKTVAAGTITMDVIAIVPTAVMETTIRGAREEETAIGADTTRGTVDTNADQL